ncbi:MAG: efflux RND transporter periplasmic adaptor subunit [Rudaea sp.]|nr:efflux RND transporter periplasmic adaptor subunit [Rudaea sp.]
MQRISTIRNLNIRALGAVLIALILFAASAASHAGETLPAAVVEIGQATTARLAPTRWVPGSVVSRDDAKIASAEAGRLEFVAEVGTRVKAGERIAKLDDEALRLRREEIQSDVRRAEAQRALSDTQLQRLAKLETSNSIAKTQIDEARATLETNVQTMAHARAQLHQIEHDIEQADVHAPFAGIVTERFAQRGEYLQVGASIVHLVDTDHIEARVQAPLAMADKIHAGMQVKVKSGGQERSANVRAVVPVGDERARQFELRVAVDPALALVGSAIEVALPEDSGNESLTVPRDALVQRQDQTYVMRVSAQNTAEQIPVTAATATGDKIEVHGALAAGDRLVVRGAERLSAGQAVKIANGG